MPRPSRYTTEIRDAIITALAASACYRDAVAAAGLPWGTWTSWLHRHKADGGHPDPDIAALIREARKVKAKAKVATTAAVRIAAQSDWRAGVELLRLEREAAYMSARTRLVIAEAKLAKIKLRDAEKGERAPVVVIELPASLARPREEPK